MKKEIAFPITELTDDLFESEKVFHADYDWDGIHHIKEADIQTHHKRILVDSEGYLLQVTGGEIIKKPPTLFKSISPPTLTVKFGLERTNKKLTLDELRKIFLHRKQDLFHITDNRLLTLEEFERRVNSASTFKELIEVATFEQEVSMINRTIQKSFKNGEYKYRTMKTHKHLLLTVSFLSYLIFSSCSDKKTDANDKEKNPFGIDSDTEAQILQPCHWSFTVEQSANGEAVLVGTAKLDSGWHLYSQRIPDKRIATEFAYDSLSAYKLLGDTEEGKPTKKYDPNLEMEVLYFENEAVFRQKIKVLSKKDFTITGTVDYAVCLNQCVFSDEEFSFEVKGNP